MHDITLTKIKEKITAQHEGDERQLNVIFSDSPRLIVEAPAGYGKTSTMISRIAYLFASELIPNPKQVLALTFSVNAALKVKREVAERLPMLLDLQNNPITVGEKITITNYHGFCKRILKKYGYLITDILRKDINLFRSVGDDEIKNIPALKAVLTGRELQTLQDMDNTIKGGIVLDDLTIHTYNNIIIEKLLPLEYVTHNAIILFVLDIFKNYTEIKKFYQNFYSLIIVDEFQDTNTIAWALLKSIISEQTQLLFLGDPLQRIYGFIGALPNIMPLATEQYAMVKTALLKNYRFRDNPEMLKIEKNIRENAAQRFAPNIIDKDVAILPALWGNTQQDEAEKITAKVQALMADATGKIALLFRRRTKNVEIIESELSHKGVSFFYGMFTDENKDYIEFHNKCKDLLVHRFGMRRTISTREFARFCDSIKKVYAGSSGEIITSLLQLLNALFKKFVNDYTHLSPEDKYNFLLDIFDNRQLKQSMEYVDSQVILSTIHGAKGLEWDYVILGDVEPWIFPGYTTCKKCVRPSKKINPVKCCCTLPKPLPTELENTILDELSVFYVGITRAKKQVYISASAKRLNSNSIEMPSMFSCMAGLDGLKLICDI